MELVQHKTNGPISVLQRSFRKQITLMVAMPIAIIAINLQYVDQMVTW
jgi:hypothetical protein